MHPHHRGRRHASCAGPREHRDHGSERCRKGPHLPVAADDHGVLHQLDIESHLHVACTAQDRENRIVDVVDLHATLFRSHIEQRTANFHTTGAARILCYTHRHRNMHQLDDRATRRGTDPRYVVQIETIVLGGHCHQIARGGHVDRLTVRIFEPMEDRAVRLAEVDNLQGSTRRRLRLGCSVFGRRSKRSEGARKTLAGIVRFGYRLVRINWNFRILRKVRHRNLGVRQVENTAIERHAAATERQRLHKHRIGRVRQIEQVQMIGGGSDRNVADSEHIRGHASAEAGAEQGQSLGIDKVDHREAQSSVGDKQQRTSRAVCLSDLGRCNRARIGCSSRVLENAAPIPVHDEAIDLGVGHHARAPERNAGASRIRNIETHRIERLVERSVRCSGPRPDRVAIVVAVIEQPGAGVHQFAVILLVRREEFRGGIGEGGRPDLREAVADRLRRNHSLVTGRLYTGIGHNQICGPEGAGSSPPPHFPWRDDLQIGQRHTFDRDLGAGLARRISRYKAGTFDGHQRPTLSAHEFRIYRVDP